MLGSSLRQSSGWTCTPNAAARSSPVNCRAAMCYPSVLLTQFHSGAVAGARSLPATVAAPTLKTQQLRTCCTTSSSQNPYGDNRSRFRSQNTRQTTSQGPFVPLLQGQSKNSATGTSDAIRQLTSTLKHSSTPHQLLQLVQQHAKQFDHIHIAAAFTHLGQWQSKQHIRAADHEEGQELLQQLEQLLSPRTLQMCECRQLSNIIWACSLLHHVHTPLMHTCLRQLLVKLGSARSLQDISNVLYASAQPGFDMSADQLQQLITAAGRQDLLRTSKPQNISNIIWAVAKMDRHRIPDLQLRRMVDALLSNNAGLMPQDVSNTLWGLARMTAAVPLLQLQQLEAALAASASRAKPDEISNTLWACAELLYYPEHLLSVLQQQQLWDTLLPHMKSQELANTALAIGELGHKDKCLMGSILQQAVKPLKQRQRSSSSSDVTGQFNVQEVCNLCWAVAVLDLQQYAAEVVYMLGTCSDQWDDLKETELSQVQQVHLWLQDTQQSHAMGLQSVLNKYLLQRCSTAWATRLQQRTEQESSAFQSGVFELLQALPVSWQIRPAMEQLSQPDGMFSIDISAVTADAVKLAIEVDGPTHFRIPDKGLTGGTLYRNRALAARGYVVVSVAAHKWAQLRSSHQQSQYLQQLLQRHVPGMQLKQQLTTASKQRRGKTGPKQAKRQRVQAPAAKLQQRSEQPTQSMQLPQQQQSS